MCSHPPHATDYPGKGRWRHGSLVGDLPTSCPFWIFKKPLRIGTPAPNGSWVRLQCGSRPASDRYGSDSLPFFDHDLVRVLVEDLAGTWRPKHAYWNSVLLQKVGYLPHSSDRLTRTVSEPTDRILRPVARRKWRAGEIGVEPTHTFPLANKSDLDSGCHRHADTAPPL